MPAAVLDLAGVKNTCPAFSSGCPYSNLSKDEITKVTEKCPAFEQGCPFKDASNLESVTNIFSQIPVSHTEGERKGDVREALKNVHKQSVAAKEEFGSCPVFASECVFKLLCSNVRPLVTELDLRSWGVLVAASSEDHDDPEEKSYLAKMLKSGTAESHRAAESVHFVRQFLRGKVEANLYKMFVVYLYHIYTAIEHEARNNAQHPIFKCVHFPEELERVPSLEEDLKFYFGEAWKHAVDKLQDEPVVRKYVDRIHYIGQTHPELLVAHAYTRYLGDLSGGQVLKRVAVKTYNLPANGDGTRFYDFAKLPSVADHKAFKNKYRQLMDALPIDKHLVDEIVAEANIAFSLNTDLFKHLDATGHLDENAPPSVPASSSSSTTTTAAAAACPFANMSSRKDPPKVEGGAAAACPFASSSSTTTTTSNTKVSACPIHKLQAFFMQPSVLLVLLAICITLLFLK